VIAAAAVVTIVAGAFGVSGQFMGDPGEQPTEPGEAAPVAEPGGPTTTPRPAPPASHFAVDETANELASFIDSPGYGQVSLDYKSAHVTVSWSGEPPRQVRELVGEQPNGVTVLLRQVPYSQPELMAAGDKVWDKLAKDGAQVATLYPNDSLTGIVVEIVKPWSGTEEELGDVAGLPVTVRFVTGLPVVGPPDSGRSKP
jgi:hypothetical protein